MTDEQNDSAEVSDVSFTLTELQNAARFLSVVAAGEQQQTETETVTEVVASEETVEEHDEETKTETETAPEQDALSVVLSRIDALEKRLSESAPKRKTPVKGSQPPALPTADVSDRQTDVITREDALLKRYSAWKKSQGIHI